MIQIFDLAKLKYGTTDNRAKRFRNILVKAGVSIVYFNYDAIFAPAKNI